MPKLILVLISTLFISACVSAGKFSTAAAKDRCGGTGGTFVNVHYGDSELRFEPPIAHVGRGGELEFRLKPRKRKSDPEGVDYEAVTVDIRGKDAAASWIKARGSYNTREAQHSLAVCVAPDQAVDTYGFIIVVDKVGELDPRARVY